MEIHTAHAETVGEFIREGNHKPFRALACPIGPSCLAVKQHKSKRVKPSDIKRWRVIVE